MTEPTVRDWRSGGTARTGLARTRCEPERPTASDYIEVKPQRPLCGVEDASFRFHQLAAPPRRTHVKATRVLTDNGKAFTDRLFSLRKRLATGQHELDLL